MHRNNQQQNLFHQFFLSLLLFTINFKAFEVLRNKKSTANKKINFRPGNFLLIWLYKKLQDEQNVYCYECIMSIQNSLGATLLGFTVYYVIFFLLLLYFFRCEF